MKREVGIKRGSEGKEGGDDNNMESYSHALTVFLSGAEDVELNLDLMVSANTLHI